MKRVIKFRGKRKNGPEILIGDLVHSCNGGPCIFPHDSETLSYNSPDYFEVDSKTVGQFTGLHDKNGKEIYEGDVIEYIPKYGDQSPRTARIIYSAFRASFAYEDHPCANNDLFKLVQNGNNVTVIGHIYESKPVMK